MNFGLILSTIISPVACAALAAWFLRTWVSARIGQSISHEYARQLEGFKDELTRNSRVWELKKDACLHALNVANAVLSNYRYENVADDDMTPQFLSIDNVRSCINELACACESPDVLDQLKRVMYEPVSPDAIVDLRNAVRRELKFSDVEIDRDRMKAFVGKINCSPKRVVAIQETRGLEREFAQAQPDLSHCWSST
jgi:hypothetical protein